MDLENVIKNSAFPVSREILIRDLRSLGIQTGDVLLVHCSLSSLGWIPGGAQTVLESLSQVLGANGTLVMPSHTTDLTDPSFWKAPPVPESWWPAVRGALPVFDAEVSPSYGIGILAETFRAWKGTSRSNHPHYSFCARGRHAQWITSDHPLSFSMGKNSPLDKIYDLNGRVLFLGSDWTTCTAFHLAEYLSGTVETGPHWAPMNVNGHRKWVEYQDLDFDSDDFSQIGLNFEKTGTVAIGMVGMAKSRLFFLREGVDFAVQYMTKDKTSGKLDIR